MKGILDSTLSLNIRQLLMMSLYKIYEEFKKRQMDGMNELQEILECLAFFAKDLDQTLKIVADEFSTIKADV